jgi:2,4-dienoyl-CoA reductase-like NADH-dependent reductase (Old Yellow Enzyme family)
MCQYSASNDGVSTYWHHVHWTTRAIGGVGLIICEATAIREDGRLTPNDLGLWNEEQAKALKTGIEMVHASGAKFAVQIGHCGRKSWGRTKGHSDFRLVSSSSIVFDEHWEKPEALNLQEIEELTECFVNSATLAMKAGADIVEIHAAHGYLLHQFLSPLSNIRTDEYGGSLENRARLLVEVASQIRSSIGQDVPLFVRISCTDFAEPNGFVLADAVKLSCMLRDVGVDVIDCSAGGTLPITNPVLREGYQLPFAEKIRKESNIKVAGVGLLTDAHFCNTALENGDCDFVVLGRELLRNPYWALHAAKQFKFGEIVPVQYVKAF